MKTLRTVLVLAACLAMGTSASAATIVDVGGGAPDGATSVSTSEAIGVIFTLTQQVTDASLTIDAVCPTCTGTLFLNKDDIGPASSVVDTVQSVAFDGGTPFAPVLSGMTLDPATYYVVVDIISGLFAWNTYSSPTITTDPSASANFDMYAAAAATYPPQSSFTLSPSLELGYTVEGTVVPEPSTALLLSLGLAIVGARRRPAA